MLNDYDSIVDDITNPRIRQAQLKATQMRTNFCNNKIPIELNNIIQRLKINIKEEDLTIDGCTRMSNDGICCIFYSKNISKVRQRFTVAHEIGHIALEHVSIFENNAQFSKKSQEKEANTFASELLVPSKDVKEFVKEKIPTMQEIIDRYWVSKEVAFIALQKNKLLNKIKII